MFATLLVIATTISTSWWGRFWTPTTTNTTVGSVFTPGSDDFCQRHIDVNNNWLYAFLDGYDVRSEWIGAPTNALQQAHNRLTNHDAFVTRKEALRRLHIGTSTNTAWWGGTQMASACAVEGMPVRHDFGWRRNPTADLWSGGTGWFPVFKSLDESAIFPGFGYDRMTNGVLMVHAAPLVSCHEWDEPSFAKTVRDVTTNNLSATPFAFDAVLTNAFAVTVSNLVHVTNNTHRLDLDQHGTANQTLACFDRAVNVMQTFVALTNLVQGGAGLKYEGVGNGSAEIHIDEYGGCAITTPPTFNWSITNETATFRTTNTFVQLSTPRASVSATSCGKTAAAIMPTGVGYTIEPGDEALNWALWPILSPGKNLVTVSGYYNPAGRITHIQLECASGSTTYDAASVILPSTVYINTVSSTVQYGYNFYHATGIAQDFSTCSNYDWPTRWANVTVARATALMSYASCHRVKGFTELVDFGSQSPSMDWGAVKKYGYAANTFTYIRSGGLNLSVPLGMLAAKVNDECGAAWTNPQAYIGASRGTARQELASVTNWVAYCSDESAAPSVIEVTADNDRWPTSISGLPVGIWSRTVHLEGHGPSDYEAKPPVSCSTRMRVIREADLWFEQVHLDED